MLPQEYRQASKEELDLRIRAAKDALGDRLVILGHFYQRDEVSAIRRLHRRLLTNSRTPTKTRPEAEAIVFCGVHFMAETADMLSRPYQAVILPNLAAGCSMADMADLESVTDCWEELEQVFGAAPDASGRKPVIPVTYMNSSAALKGFCGQHGGIVCTSSNAAQVLEWALARGQRALFFPDQHLGRNTGKAMGIPLEQMPLWNPDKPLGGCDEQTLRQSRVILWHGFCSVHERFPSARLKRLACVFQASVSSCTPSVPWVVDAADASGSTDFITRAIAAAPAGGTFAIGTEINLVQRLANQNPQHKIFFSTPSSAPVRPCIVSTPVTSHGCWKRWSGAKSQSHYRT